MALTDLAIRKLLPTKTPFKRADGQGLHIYVTPAGSKLWRMSYRFEGKTKLLSFGPYPTVGLAQARRKCENAKALLVEGIDPSAQKKAEAAERAAIIEHTFEKIAAELIEKHRLEGKSASTLKKKTWYISLVTPDLGHMPIRDIATTDILVPLRRIEARGNYETARRVRAMVGQVFRYAVATARVDQDPTFSLRGALITPKVTHRAAAITQKDYAQVVRAVWTYKGGAITTQAAMKLMALLYPRPGELRLARWSEFDLEEKVWTIPAERAKMRREHRKPLPKVAVKILRELRPYTGEDRAFPSLISRDRPMSENTMNQALRRMGFAKDEMTSHGFRASASSLLNESGKWSEDAIEAELAHAGSNQVRRAYHRAEYWDERVKMAKWWAKFIKKMVEES